MSADNTDAMIDEAMALLRRAQDLLLAARKKHEATIKGRAIEMLREDARREIYETADRKDTTRGSGEFAISHSYGRGPTLSATDVRDLLDAGLITHKWPDRQDLHVYRLTERRGA